MHCRKKFPRIKSVLFHLFLLCTKFQSPRSKNELVGPLNSYVKWEHFLIVFLSGAAQQCLEFAS